LSAETNVLRKGRKKKAAEEAPLPPSEERPAGEERRPGFPEEWHPGPSFAELLDQVLREDAGEEERRRPPLRALAEAALREKDSDGRTAAERIVRAVIGKAENGDLKAFEILRDMADGKPSDKPRQEAAVIRWEGEE